MTALTTHEAFYADLTTNNRGFVSDEAQGRLAQITVLVAGCGSTGGAAVEPLVRLGVQRFLLGEPGAYELNNLNRQSAALRKPVVAELAQRDLAASQESAW